MNIYNYVLSNKLLENLHNFTRDGKQPSRTNFFNYAESLVSTSNVIFAFDIPDDLKNLVLEELIAKKIFLKHPKKWSCYINLFSRGSFIPWHNDEKYALTGTIYLNQNWHKDFGGLFLYEDNLEIKALIPEYNKGCFFVPPVNHTTTLTSINSPLRETLQIFVENFEG